jgi:hypothetical protein
LCNLIGRDVKNDLLPDDNSLLGPMVKNICYANAKNYLAFPGLDAPMAATQKLKASVPAK